MKQIVLELARFFNTDFLLKISSRNAIVPLYHTVSDQNLLHIKHLYPVKSTKAFIKDLDFLLKYFAPISYFDYTKALQEGKNFNKPSFLLTFDDGLKEFFTVIAPILKQKGIPALCFLNSGFIDNKELFYRYKVSLLINYIKENKLNKMVLNTFSLVFKSEDKFFDTLLKAKYSDNCFLDEIAYSIDFSFNHFLRTQQPYLTTEQIKTLIQQGFCFGAHSINHPLYAHLTLKEQLNQTQYSLYTICKQFNLNYKAFAFPFTDTGIKRDFFTEIYKNNIAEITFGTGGLKTDEYEKNIQRIPMEQDLKSAKSIINTEIIKAILRTATGKNKVLHL